MKGNIPEEQQAQEQTQFLAGLIEHISQPMIIASADKRLCLWNAAFSKLTGYTDKELGDPIISAGLTAPEWHEGETKALEKLRRTGQTQTFQKEYIRKDGSRVPVEVLIYQVTGDASKVQYYVGLITDITERKQLEEALQKSEGHYRTLVDNAIEGIVVTQNGEIKFVNPIVAVVSGYSIEELQSMSLKDLVCTDNEKAIIKSLSKAAAPGALYIAPPFRIRTKAGESRWIEDTVVSIMWNDEAANLNLLRDITEHKRLGEYLEQERQEANLIIDSSPIIVFYKDKDGRFVRVNKAFAEAIQMPEENVLGKTVFDLYPAKIAQAMTGDDQKVLKSGRPKLNITEQYESATGIRWVRTDKVPIFDKDGNPTGLVGFAQDITERKEADEVLSKSEEKYRTILEDMKEGYWEVDLAGNFTSFNDAICHLLGYPKRDMTGMNYRTYTGAEDVDKVYKAFNQVYRKGKPIRNMHYEITRKDGDKRFAETSVFPRRNDKREIIGFRGVSHDVTERKEMEEALRRSEERYRTILDEMEDSYFEVDLAGNWTFVNEANCHQMGYSREEMIGSSYQAIFPGEDAKKVYEAFHQIYLTGQPSRDSTFKVIRKDGSTGVGEFTAFPLRNERGEIIGFRGVGRDVTERMRMEEALRQSEERYRTILNEMEQGYFEADLAGNYILVNEASCRQLGYPKEELIGMNYRDIIASDDIENVYKNFNKVYRKGQPIRAATCKIVRKEGRTSVREFSVFPLRNNKGKIVGFRGVSRDITERMQMEEALRQSEEGYRPILEALKDTYFEVDLAGNFTL